MRVSRFAFVMLLSFGCLALQPSLSSAEDAKIPTLIVTGHDVLPAHPWRDTTPLIRQQLEASGKFDVKVCEDTSILESSKLDAYKVIVLNFGFWDVPQLSERAQQNLLTYVRDGGGLMPLHFACSSYQDWPEYAELIGRVWVKGKAGHGPRSTFTVNIVDKDHPITAGVADFQADDELYAKLDGDAEIHVLATADSDWSNKTEPLLFVKKYGKGNVVHNLLGHDVKARDYPEYATLLVRGAEWAATGKVSN
ncbi:MAG: ThuA domain-containing protein [Pirellulaceae bacterium]